MYDKNQKAEQNPVKLQQIYEKYKNRMYISALRILKNPQSAEDAVHDAFVAIAKNIKKLQDTDSLSTASYVIKAAKNTALNMAKKSSDEKTVPIYELDIASDESLLDEICTKENYTIIVSSIMALDEKYRDVLSLYYLNELTVGEIAVALSRKETTVKQQLVRGRRKLIETIKKEVCSYEKR